MYNYCAFILNDNSKKRAIAEAVKNTDLSYVPNAKEPQSAGKSVGFLCNQNLNLINLEKCLQDAVNFSFDLDEDCKKYIFIICDNFDINKINKILESDINHNFFENYCNFYFLREKKEAFSHPNVNFLNNLQEIYTIINSI